MRSKEILSALILPLGVWFALPSMAQSQTGVDQFRLTNVAPHPQDVKTTFVHLGPGVPGVLYEPVTPGPKSAIAVFVMHSSGDYLENSACTELSRRGYRVLCANSTTAKAGDENDLDMDQVVLDAKLGMVWLRKQSGIRKIVLLGHSGGGVLMSSYQGVAEGGLKACQGPEKVVKCPDSFAGLPGADGVMLLDSNYGLPTMTLFSIDPAVIDETSGQKIDPALNLWNPQNGFSASGAKYTTDFTHRFQAAVAKRYDQLVKTALARLQQINAGQGRFKDNEPFVVPGANYNGHNNKFFTQDPRFLSHTRRAWPLLHKNGTMTTEIVHTVRVPEDLKPTTASWLEGTLKSTVRRFLSTNAVRVSGDFGYDEDSIRGVDWTSSYATPPGTVRDVTVPLLTMGMTGHYEYLAAEIIYDNAKSADKTIAFVEGAQHGFTPCTECAVAKGLPADYYGDTMKTLFDYVDGWLSKPGRF